MVMSPADLATIATIAKLEREKEQIRTLNVGVRSTC